MIEHHKSEPVIGFEQEYYLFSEGRPLGWKDGESPAPQGPYYCAVGEGNVAGRNISELHLNSCINSGLSMVGVNAEVALGQWEYQVGGPGVNAVAACDHLWVSRYILQRVAESLEVSVSFDPKPYLNWNGSGLHSNFSTKTMRADNGIELIAAACEALSEKDALAVAIDNYGEGLERRLTGDHETCSITEFRYGVSDRGASVRIPWHVDRQGAGYFEDRRPNSNADPYRVATALIGIVSPLDAETELLAETELPLSGE
jgi:glutamine synthetase